MCDTGFCTADHDECCEAEYIGQAGSYTDCGCDDRRTYTRDDARDDHAINQWEIANDLRDDT